MKVVSTTGLTKLIQLIKDTFIDKDNTIPVSTVNLADVATTGSYNDLLNKPTIPTVDQSYSSSSTNAQSGTAVAQALATVSVDIDGKSITTNTDDELQTIGVIDQNNTSNAIKTWTGTKLQYDAIVSKDANTLYNITDDTDVTLTLLNALYPVGAIYIGTCNACPLATLGVGTWQLVAVDRVLQGATDGTVVGSTVEAGLPNITGGFYVRDQYVTNDGAFYRDNSKTVSGYYGANSAPATGGMMFDASRSSSIYGNSNTVQPPAYLVNIWERVS